MIGDFEERIVRLTEEQAKKEGERCMSCGLCFECDNCVIYCPQTAVARVPKKERAVGRYVYTRLYEVHRLPHLRRRLPDRLHPDGPRGVSDGRRLAASHLCLPRWWWSAPRSAC